MRAYRIAYDGEPYYGFQRQPDVPTVSDTILDALRELDVLDADEDVPPGYAAAGRTDAGVSAVAQTVAFDAPEWLSPRALSAALPEDVYAWAAADTPDEFHATHDAERRTYVYHCHAPEADPDRARAALDRLAGEHDFHNLTLDDDGTVRRLETELTVDEPFLVVTLTAGGFPRQLVRRAVALVRSVATGDSSLDRIDRALSADPLPGPEGIEPASALPLVLAAVAYPTLTFTVDSRAVDAARAAFDGTRIERATGARTAAALVERLD